MTVVYDNAQEILGFLTYQPWMTNEAREEVVKLGVLGSYSSCGVSVLVGLSNSTPAEKVKQILDERSRSDKYIREAFVTFSDIDYAGGGNALYEYIKRNNLGNIVEFGPRKNPNTGNMIKLWVWEPPHENLDVTNKNMKVAGKRRKLSEGGLHCEYVDGSEGDQRFQSNLREGINEAVPAQAEPPQGGDIPLAPARTYGRAIR